MQMAEEQDEEDDDDEEEDDNEEEEQAELKKRGGAPPQQRPPVNQMKTQSMPVKEATQSEERFNEEDEEGEHSHTPTHSGDEEEHEHSHEHTESEDGNVGNLKQGPPAAKSNKSLGKHRSNAQFSGITSSKTDQNQMIE